MQPWTQTLIEAEDSLRKLEESIHLMRTGWPVAGPDPNGPTNGAALTPEALRRLTTDLGDIIRRCEDLPKERGFDRRICLGEPRSGHTSRLGHSGPSSPRVAEQTSGCPGPGRKARSPGREERSAPSAGGKAGHRTVPRQERAREFLDSWPWSTGNKPGDEEDAAAAQRR